MNGILSEVVSSDERAWTVIGVARDLQVLKFQGIKESEDDRVEVEENEGMLVMWLLVEKVFDSWWWREEEKVADGVAVLAALKGWESKVGMVEQWLFSFVIILCLVWTGSVRGVEICEGQRDIWREREMGRKEKKEGPSYIRLFIDSRLASLVFFPFASNCGNFTIRTIEQITKVWILSFFFCVCISEQRRDTRYSRPEFLFSLLISLENQSAPSSFLLFCEHPILEKEKERKGREQTMTNKDLNQLFVGFQETLTQ